MTDRILKMVKSQAETKRQEALTSLQLLMENSAGIGDHSTEDFYKNVSEAFQKLTDADDLLETINKYNWNNIDEIK
jgi:hypothetical protein